MKITGTIILFVVIFSSLFAQDNIINEVAKDGKFIVRDTDLYESMVIEDRDVTIFGNLKFDNLTEGNEAVRQLGWDENSKSVKLVPKTISEMSLSLRDNSWHELGYGEVNDLGNPISTSNNSTNAVSWNQFNTDYGYIKFGPANKSIAHIYTDKALFKFNRGIVVRTGLIRSVKGFDIRLRTGTTPRLIILENNGNVGIGTETPDAKLEIAGQVKITGGSPGSGKVLTSDGTGLASWQIPSGGSGGSSIWFESDDNIYRSTGNVGIGISDPSEKLEVYGNAIIGNSNETSFLHVGNNFFSSNSGDLNPGLYLYKNDAIAYGLKLQSTNGEYGTMMFGPNLSNTHLSFGKTGNTLQDDNMIEYMRIDLDNGNVGIGTSTPVTKLDVDGSVCATRYGTKDVYTITNGTWELSNGNIAEVNYSSGITPITINSDGCVGTFVLVVKKSSSCSTCTLDFQGVNIMWAYGVQPTLSSGSNTTDIISLIAVGNNTFYGYTANNFF